MIPIQHKKNYLTAVLSGSLNRTQAYITYINPASKHPSQAAYRLEQSDTMRRLTEIVQQELCQTKQVQEATLSVTTESLSALEEVLQDKSANIDQRLAAIRLANRLNAKANKTLEAILGSNISESLAGQSKLDRTQIIID